MNKFNKLEILYISVSIIFTLFTLVTVYETLFTENSLEINISSWEKGINELINDIKSIHTIKDFEPNYMKLSRFSTPPSISTESPAANLILSDIEYSFISNQLIKRAGNSILPLLENVKSFTFTPVNKNLEKTEELENICGFIIFIIFENNDQEIPVEFTVFSEYLYQKKVYPNFFDFVDDREFF